MISNNNNSNNKSYVISFCINSEALLAVEQYYSKYMNSLLVLLNFYHSTKKRQHSVDIQYVKRALPLFRAVVKLFKFYMRIYCIAYQR